jgi:hypothetical protein
LQLVYEIVGVSDDRLTLRSLMDEKFYYYFRSDEWATPDEWKRRYHIGGIIASDDDTARPLMALREKNE